ncbi:MAG: hypothetical protein DRQ78_04815 [Epsilonproteobacteria bacterium]|nr:MAG: hypothetical protein DRQ78_04815 [Campylobacterota bacterium]
MAQTLTASEPRVGISESMYHAQVIVKAFSEALQKTQCMSRIPIAIYTETILFEDRIIHTLDYFDINHNTDPDIPEFTSTFTYTNPITEKDKSTKQEPEARNSSDEIKEYKRSWAEECFDCGWDDFPDFDLDRLFDSILRRIEGFIAQIKRLFDLRIPNYCPLTSLLSYTCIPDLVAILALLLAAILKLIGPLVISLFSLTAFILGIIEMIISALLQFALSMIRYALTPIYCLLDTLADIANRIPTDEVLQKRLSDNEYELLYGSRKDGEARDIPSAISGVRSIVESMDATAGAVVKDTLESVGDVVSAAAESVDDTIEDLMALLGFLECEPERSGFSIMDKIEAIIELMQVINIIMALIDRKSQNDAFDKLCKPEDKDEYSIPSGTKSPGSNGDNGKDDDKDKDRPKPLTPEEIAEVIQEALGVDTTIVENEDGLQIGIIIKRDVEYQTRLDFYTCDIPEIIKEYTMESIIDRATAIPDDVLFGRGPGRPSSLNIETIKVSEITDVIDESTGIQFLPFDPLVRQDTSLDDIIKDVISTKVRNSPPRRESRQEVENNEGLKTADTVPGINDYSLGIEVTNSIPPSTFGKTIELKCGSIENIQEQFMALEDNK